MAANILLQNFRKLKDKYDYTVAACPVIIEFCDASAKSRSFSEALVDCYIMGGYPLGYFFSIGANCLFSYLDGKLPETQRIEAVKRLEEFLSDEKHNKCLLSLHQSKHYSEFEIQIILAAHLFGPLAGNCKIGNRGFPEDVKAKRCPVCSQNISASVQDTSLGNGKVWHGHADILVNRSIVMIAPDSDKDDDSGEPLLKKRRTSSTGDDEGLNSDDSFESESIVEVKRDFVIGSRVMSQGLAQTIVNAFCEANAKPYLSSSFIPSFIATGQNISITMYNIGLDSLIMTKNLKIFCEDETETTLNFSTILNVWYALSFEMFFDETDSVFLALYEKSKFKDQVGDKFSIYKENCTKPMEGKELEKSFEFNIDFRYAYSSKAIEIMKEVDPSKRVVESGSRENT